MSNQVLQKLQKYRALNLKPQHVKQSSIQPIDHSGILILFILINSGLKSNRSSKDFQHKLNQFIDEIKNNYPETERSTKKDIQQKLVQNQELERYKNKLKELSYLNSQSQTQKMKYISELEILKERIEELKQKNEILQSENEKRQLRKDSEILRLSESGLDGQNQDSQEVILRQNQTINQQREDISMLVVEVYQLKNSNETLKKQYENVDSNYNNLKRQIEELKEKNNNLLLEEIKGIQNAVKQILEYKDRMIEQLESKYNQQQDKLDNIRYLYDNRISEILENCNFIVQSKYKMDNDYASLLQQQKQKDIHYQNYQNNIPNLPSTNKYKKWCDFSPSSNQPKQFYVAKWQSSPLRNSRQNQTVTAKKVKITPVCGSLRI